MNKILRKVIITSILILLFLVSIYEITPEMNNVKKSRLEKSPPVRLSILPEDISMSFVSLETEAKELKQLLNKKGISFNYINLAGEKYINKTTPVIIQTYYKKSNKLKQDVISMPESFVGLSIQEFRSIAKGWEIKEYSPGKIMILYKSLEKLAPEDREKMHLGIKNGRVAIFYGESGNDHLKKITEIKVEDLSYQEQEDLKSGIVVNSEEELLSILDGFISNINQD